MDKTTSGTPESCVDKPVPGDFVLDLSNMANQMSKLGGCLRQDCGAIAAIKAGTLKFSKRNKYWVTTSQKRNFLVDTKGPTLAFLPVPGETYQSLRGKAAEYGPLKEGYMFECSTSLSRMLLSSPRPPVLEVLGKKISYETAVGLNGHVWVNAGWLTADGDFCGSE